jgi:hypothetical protein
LKNCSVHAQGVITVHQLVNYSEMHTSKLQRAK